MNKKTTVIGTLINQKQLIYMSLPLVLYIILFAYVPLWGWTMAFQNFRPERSFTQQEWVGFGKFMFLFTDPGFMRVLRNTLAMSLINMVLGYVTAIGLALLLNELRNIGFKRIVQTVSYLPHFLSWVIVTGLVSSVLEETGVVNSILLGLGLTKTSIQFLAEPNYFWGIIGATYVWKEVGWNTIIYLAAIAGIDPNLYEAAEIDGCNRFHKMWFITLPGIKATIVILLIMSIGRILDAGFEMQYLLMRGSTMDVAETIDIFVLRYGIQSDDFSLATAAGMFKNVVNVSLIFLANWLAKRMGEERLV